MAKNAPLCVVFPFEKAKKDALSIIFIDELDSIGRVRGTGLGGGHDEREKEVVEKEDFDEGRDKILMGIEREEALKDEEKEVIAYHEAGHALMARLLPGADPLEKVSIIPRGRSMGATENEK